MAGMPAEHRHRRSDVGACRSMFLIFRGAVRPRHGADFLLDTFLCPRKEKYLALRRNKLSAIRFFDETHPCVPPLRRRYALKTCFPAGFWPRKINERPAAAD